MLYALLMKAELLFNLLKYKNFSFQEELLFKRSCQNTCQTNNLELLDTQLNDTCLKTEIADFNHMKLNVSVSCFLGCDKKWDCIMYQSSLIPEYI